ncbi:hypothetical protein JXL83_00845 [candidate division WOR-3 bacterium]|nr:hypothetical protein [candidate division WOR-3 bacterium]
MQEEKKEELQNGFPDIEKLKIKYFDRYEKMKDFSTERNGLNFEFIKGAESHVLSKVLAFFLVFLSALSVFFIFPRTGFNPNFFLKILIFLIMTVLSGMLSFLFNVVLINLHKKKIVKAVDFFLSAVLTGSKNSELEVAALKTWSRRNKDDYFLETVKERIKLFSKGIKIDRKLLSECEEYINRITKIDLEERRKAEAAENARDKADWEARLKDKEQAREALRQKAYRLDQFDKSYDRLKLKSELIPFAENLSQFKLIFQQISYAPRENDTNPLNGDLFMAVSPNFIVLLLGIGAQTGPDKAEFLLDHNRTYPGNVLYIIPPEFIVNLKREAGGKTYISFAEPLNGIPVTILTVGTHAVTHQKIKTITRTYTGPLKEIRVKFDEILRSMLDPNLDMLAPKTALDPVCPICKKFSHVQKTGGKDTAPGYTCTSCGTRYRWGVDYLRRIILFPVKNNEKNATPEKWI